MRLRKLNTSICTFTLVKSQGQWTIMWMGELHIYYRITSCILNKVVKVEKGLGRTTETFLAIFKPAALQQQKRFICKEANYRSVKVKIIPSVTFLHWETESQKWKHPVGTCKFETFLVVPKFPWASLLFLDNMPDRDLKCLGLQCLVTSQSYFIQDSGSHRHFISSVPRFSRPFCSTSFWLSIHCTRAPGPWVVSGSRGDYFIFNIWMSQWRIISK